MSTGHDVPAIQFDARLLSHRVAHAAQADKAGEAARAFEPPVPAETDELASIEAVAALALCEAYPRIDWVAAKLGLTRRTLQRRLAERGTTLAALVEMVLRKHAQDLLVRTSEPVTSIAMRLALCRHGAFHARLQTLDRHGAERLSPLSPLAGGGR